MFLWPVLDHYKYVCKMLKSQIVQKRQNINVYNLFCIIFNSNQFVYFYMHELLDLRLYNDVIYHIPIILLFYTVGTSCTQNIPSTGPLLCRTWPPGVQKYGWRSY